MKIAITSTGPTLDDNIDPRFGRCAYFLIIDPETLDLEAVENPNIALGGGAGIQSGQMMANKGVGHVLTGNCGPNAFQTLGAAGIQVITGVGGPVRQAVQQFKAGALESASSSNVQSHFGMGTGTGGGMGMGGGRGMGMGGGRGRGMGRGMGMGRGLPGGSAAPAEPSAQPVGRISEGREIDDLKSQAGELGEQLKIIQQRIGTIVEDGRAAPVLVATVDPEKCDACGVCRDVCPNGAVSVNHTAYIDRTKCLGCGQCVAECPKSALFLRKVER